MSDEREADVEKRCDAIAAAYGYRVIRLSQRRASGIHAGLPDRRYQGPRGALFFEVKRVGGKLTADQRSFLLDELDAGCLATCGTAIELKAVFDMLVRDPTLAAGLCRAQVERWASKGLRREAA